MFPQIRERAADLPILRVTESVILSESLLPLARKHSLTAYDVLYLDLAVRRRATLATYDRRLRAAAEAEGLTVLP